MSKQDMALLSPFQLPSELLISSLCSQFPCREQQIRSLAAILSPFVKSPKNIVLYGLEATGKTSVITSLLSSLQSSKNSVVDGNGHYKDANEPLQYAIVKSAECITGRHLLETAISATADALGLKGSVSRCENLAQLAVGISYLLEGRTQNGPGGLIYPNEGKFVLVFDGIDKQRDAPPTLLPALARLAETISNLSIIFIVTSPRPHFLHTPGVPHIHFSAYNKAEALQIMALKPPPINGRSKSPLDTENQAKVIQDTKDIWVRFCGAVWDTLSKHSGRDLLSFRESCQILWPSFAAPLRDSSFTTKDFSRLLVSQRSLFQDERVLVPGIIPGSITKISQTTTAAEQVKDPKLRSGHQIGGITTQLPLFSRLLLIAAYLASFTPARHDQVLFMKSHSKGRRKRGGGTSKARPRTSKHRKISGKLLGPQSFVMERLLAIFHAMRIDAGVGNHKGWLSTADIPMAIATLASLRLVVKTSNVADPLDASTKWKINVGWDVIRGLARSVDIEVEDFLLD